METTYTNQAPRRRPNHRRRSVSLAPREQRRLVQLCVCTALFLVVFLGRGVFPEKLQAVRQDLLKVLQTDTDFTAAFANLGRAIENKEPVVDTLEGLWVDVFAGGQPAAQVFAGPKEHAASYYQEKAFLLSDPSPESNLTRRFGSVPALAAQPAAETPPPPAQPEPTPEAVLPPEPKPVYTGPALPDNATMEQLPLGLDATAAPVMAPVSSGYGWREHPIEGGEKFHAGADLAAPYGDPIGAFADGVVDYIGESPAYGQYLQIKHDGGVTSFYAHCSKLCVQPGQTVKMGEKVAEVGDTGEATGAHLHFELKLNGELLNPLYYIETE